MSGPRLRTLWFLSMTASYDRVSSLRVSKPYLFHGHSGCCPELFLQVRPLHIFLFVFTPLWLISPTPTALLRDLAASLEKPASIKPQNSKEGSFPFTNKTSNTRGFGAFQSRLSVVSCSIQKLNMVYRLEGILYNECFYSGPFFIYCSQVSTHKWFLKARTGSEWQPALSVFLVNPFHS